MDCLFVHAEFLLRLPREERQELRRHDPRIALMISCASQGSAPCKECAEQAQEREHGQPAGCDAP